MKRRKGTKLSSSVLGLLLEHPRQRLTFSCILYRFLEYDDDSRSEHMLEKIRMTAWDDAQWILFDTAEMISKNLCMIYGVCLPVAGSSLNSSEVSSWFYFTSTILCISFLTLDVRINTDRHEEAVPSRINRICRNSRGDQATECRLSESMRPINFDMSNVESRNNLLVFCRVRR